MQQAPLDPAEQKCVDDIAEHGCHVMKVFDNEGDLPDFAYSVGLPVSVGQPEVLIYGLRPELMHSMINEVYRQCSEGLELFDGRRIQGLIDGHDCIVRLCTDRTAIEEHLGWALWYHHSQREKDVNEFFQIVWPGAVDGLFPWEAGASSEVIDAQPTLYEVAK
ncbi:MAG: DUF4262 domain-containing protein [Erythrobacter sp.]|nr:DUF4262 domain-containing protein [Erythrobacter sp.]